MPAHANVFINYGPYKSKDGIVDHRKDRLDGLKGKTFPSSLFYGIIIFKESVLKHI